MKCAILGYGVVGSGALEVLSSYNIKVKRVLDIRPHEELGDILTNDYNVILSDDEIGVVAEAIGGLEPAHTFVVQALKAKKHVVSSNKHLICTYYDELNKLAKENGVTLRFTSSAGGGIPWLYNLKRTARCDTITKIMGIMNGTTNFILDAMISNGSEFDAVLKEAQRLGYAEANPSADIDGLDTARKVAISSSIAFNTIVTEDNVDTFSLRNIRKCDINYITEKLGKTIRYLGYGVNNNGVVSAFVEPTLLDSSSLESNVTKNFNMITLFGENVGRLSFYGQGAGKYPTGSSLAQDIIDILSGNTEFYYNPSEVKIDNSSLKRKYFIRTNAPVDKSLIESEETIDNNKFIITKQISVCEIHSLANGLSDKDNTTFVAGIEE